MVKAQASTWSRTTIVVGILFIIATATAVAFKQAGVPKVVFAERFTDCGATCALNV